MKTLEQVDVIGARGTSRCVQERFASDEAYEDAKARVRLEARQLLDEQTLIEAVAETERTDSADPLLRELGLAVRFGTWNAHRAVWDRDLFGVVDELDGGTLYVAPREAPRLRGLRGDRAALLEYLTVLGLSHAKRIVLDPTSNVFLNEGTEFLWRRATGVGTQDQLFDNSHSRIGVGDSSTAATRDQATQGLLGSNKSYATMEAGYPTITAGTSADGAKATFKGVYAGGVANHAHLEWVVDNKTGGTPGTKTMNRKVQNFGTKESGDVWTYTFDLEIK